MKPSLIKKDMTALITGAGSGLGFEFAKQLSSLGLNLILVSMDSNKLEKAIQELESSSKSTAKIRTFSCNLSKEESVTKLIAFLEENNIQVDILINNAGIGLYGKFCDFNSIEHQTLINLNVCTPVILTNEILKNMTENNTGIILNVASSMAFRPAPKWSVYAATKSFLYSFSCSLQLEFADTNILISVLLPGKINTNFDINAGYKSSRTGKHPQEIVTFALKMLEKRKKIIIPGNKPKLVYYIFKFFPRFFIDNIVRFLN